MLNTTMRTKQLNPPNQPQNAPMILNIEYDHLSPGFCSLPELDALLFSQQSINATEHHSMNEQSQLGTAPFDQHLKAFEELLSCEEPMEQGSVQSQDYHTQKQQKQSGYDGVSLKSHAPNSFQEYGPPFRHSYIRPDPADNVFAPTASTQAQYLGFPHQSTTKIIPKAIQYVASFRNAKQARALHLDLPGWRPSSAQKGMPLDTAKEYVPDEALFPFVASIIKAFRDTSMIFDLKKPNGKAMATRFRPNDIWTVVPQDIEAVAHQIVATCVLIHLSGATNLAYRRIPGMTPQLGDYDDQLTFQQRIWLIGKLVKHYKTRANLLMSAGSEKLEELCVWPSKHLMKETDYLERMLEQPKEVQVKENAIFVSLGAYVSPKDVTTGKSGVMEKSLRDPQTKYQSANSHAQQLSSQYGPMQPETAQPNPSTPRTVTKRTQQQMENDQSEEKQPGSNSVKKKRSMITTGSKLGTPSGGKASKKRSQVIKAPANAKRQNHSDQEIQNRRVKEQVGATCKGFIEDQDLDTVLQDFMDAQIGHCAFDPHVMVEVDKEMLFEFGNGV